MDLLYPSQQQFTVRALVEAIAQHTGPDAFTPAFNALQWELLGTYLQPFALRAGQVLIAPQATDRTVYLVESGSLTVHREDDRGRIRLAAVGAGSAVGEGAFFSRQQRQATVQAATVGRVWALSPIRFAELSHRQPAMALEVVMALGALLARRVARRSKRVAVT